MTGVTVSLEPESVEPGRRDVGTAGAVDELGRQLSRRRGQRGRPFPVDTILGKLIEERGLTLHEVSMRTDINTRSISYYLSRQRPIPRANARILAKVLDVDVDVLRPMTTGTFQ